MNLPLIDSIVAQHLNNTFTAAQIVIRERGAVVHENTFGVLDPSDLQSPITNLQTRFDLASVSKLFTVAAFMTYVEQGRIALDQPVSTILPEFSGRRAIAPYPDPLHPGKMIAVVPATQDHADASRVTFRHLLSHNSGLPAWLGLWRLPKREDRRALALTCDFSYPTGERVVYSDMGLILVGFALEKLADASLDEIVHQRVALPLGLESVGYGPIPPDNVAPTEFYAHQNRRLRGEVHDENAWSFGGVAGHAGVFANAHDLASFGEAMRTNQLLKPVTLAEMTRLQAQDGAVRRGIGFMLRSPDPGSVSYPFSESVYGHTGFTGTSLFIDPERELVVAILTNRVYYGRENAADITKFRLEIHNAIIK